MAPVGSSIAPPAAACTATPKCFRPRRLTRSLHWRRTECAKLAAEGYCRLYSQLHGLSTISLRYGNVYGPRQDIHGEAGVVAVFCGRLVDGVQPTVFGDGRQTRDWVEVSDVVNANLLALSGDLGGAVNIGHGREASVLDLLEALRQVGAARGWSLASPEFAPARLGEVQRSCLDVARARDELGWVADVTLSRGARANAGVGVSARRSAGRQWHGVLGRGAAFGGQLAGREQRERDHR